MTTTHRNAQNITASLRHLNEATGHRYVIRNEGSNYILVSPRGCEYPAKTSLEIQTTLMNMKNAAQGRTR
jgi:hypothetical protein